MRYYVSMKQVHVVGLLTRLDEQIGINKSEK